MISEESLRDIGVQAKVIECFIEHYQELFSDTNSLNIEFTKSESFHEISFDKAVARSQSVKNISAFGSHQHSNKKKV